MSGVANQLDFPTPYNAAERFIDRNLKEGRGAKPVIFTFEETVTYAQLAERAKRAGNALLALGIGKGDRVLMMIKDCPTFYYIFWGAIRAGIIPVPLNTLLRAKDYAFMIEDSGCAAVLYSPEFASEVEPALAQSTHKPKVAMAATGPGNGFDPLLAKASAELAAQPSTAEGDCFWLYSSGTTGSPKGAVHAQRDMEVTCRQYAVTTLGAIEGDIFFSIPRLFFAYGLGCAMTFPLWVGGAAVLDPRRPTPDTVMEVLTRFRPTVFAAVPTFYTAMIHHLEGAGAKSHDFSHLRRCVTGGEALPPEMFKKWKELTGGIAQDGIGSTEALHIYISNRFDDIKPGASGKPVPGYECRILDPEGKEVPVGESGRLFIRGQSIAKYYWNNPKKTAETMVEGWLNTGDTYLKDADGYYFYCGRSDDMLKVGGIWVSPFEIESALVEHPKVLEAAVVGRADDEGLIKPEAYIVLKDGRDAGDGLVKDLQDHCKKTRAPYKYPRWVNFVAELPKTATGKIQRFKLRH